MPLPAFGDGVTHHVEGALERVLDLFPGLEPLLHFGAEPRLAEGDAILGGALESFLHRIVRHQLTRSTARTCLTAGRARMRSMAAEVAGASSS